MILKNTILRTGLLVSFLSVLFCTSPAGGHAQTSSVATVVAIFDQPEIHTGPDSKKESKAEKKTEEEERNEYRHSATVQWVSKTIGVDVEKTAKAFEYINFAIIVLAVGIPLVKFLPRVLRKRAETLTQELETARQATLDANTRLTAVEAKLSGLDGEIAAIRKQVEQDMVADEARIKASIQEESARIVAAAEQEIAVAGALEQRGLKRFAADLAIDRALTQLTFDADTDRALIAEFARDAAGGKN